MSNLNYGYIKMKFSILKHYKSKQVQTVDYSLSTVTQGLTNPVKSVSSKDKLPLWSPTIFEGNRNQKNAKYITMLVYDIDDGTSLESWRCFSDHYVMIHTSYSHKPHFNKFRIIIPLETPIPAQDWNRASIAAVDHWENTVGVGEIDKKVMKNSACIYYRYSIPDSDLPIDSPLHPVNYHYSNYHVGPLFQLEFKHIEIKKRIIKKIDFTTRKSVELDDLMLDSNFRFQSANKLGASISGNNAKGIMCPNCNRPNVVFSIDLSIPNAIKWPKCNHQESCKWWGSLESLLGGVL